MSTFLSNKTISKTMPLRKENSFPQFNVASHKRPVIRLSFEYTTTLLSGEGGKRRTAADTIISNMLLKYKIFSTVFCKIRTRVFVALAPVFRAFLHEPLKSFLRHIVNCSMHRGDFQTMVKIPF